MAFCDSQWNSSGLRAKSRYIVVGEKSRSVLRRLTNSASVRSSGAHATPADVPARLARLTTPSPARRGSPRAGSARGWAAARAPGRRRARRGRAVRGRAPSATSSRISAQTAGCRRRCVEAGVVRDVAAPVGPEQEEQHPREALVAFGQFVVARSRGIGERRVERRPARGRRRGRTPPRDAAARSSSGPAAGVASPASRRSAVQDPRRRVDVGELATRLVAGSGRAVRSPCDRTSATRSRAGPSRSCRRTLSSTISLGDPVEHQLRARRQEREPVLDRRSQRAPRRCRSAPGTGRRSGTRGGAGR